MFIEINNTEMNAQKVDEWVKLTRRANGDVLSPEFALEILSKTNHIANIKTVLKNIKAQCVDENKKLVPEKVAQYKEFILSCVDGREQSEMIMADLRELAEACGCKDELEIINNNEKVYSNTDVKGVVVRDMYDRNNMENMLNLGIPVFIDINKVYNGNILPYVRLREMDFSNVIAIRAKDLSDLSFDNVSNLPEKVILENTSVVKFIGSSWRDGVEKLDVSKANTLMIKECTNVPENIDASNCNVVNFEAINLSNWDKIKFGDDVILTLKLCENVSENFDVSFVSDLYIYGTDISKAKDLKFKDGANVVMDSAKVNYNTEIVTVVPEFLDFSHCDKVKFSARPLEVKEIWFKNREQAGEWVDIMFYCRDAKTVFVDEENAKKEKLLNSAPINNDFEI